MHYVSLLRYHLSSLLYFYSHALAQSHITHEYYQIKESKQSIPHQIAANGEEYAVSSKAVGNASEKQQQQQQQPLVEYAEVDNSKNKSPQQHNIPSGYEINENIIIANKEVSVYVHTYLIVYL